MNLRMNRRTKLVVLMIAITLAGTAVVATQFIKATATYSFSIRTLGASVNLVASDGNPTGSGYVLQNRSADTGFSLILGTWGVGTAKVFTAAFGIVNLESENLRVTNINVIVTTGAGNDDLVTIYLHENESKAANSVGLPSGSTDAETQTGTPDDCAVNGGDATLRYWDGPGGDPDIVAHDTDGFILDNLTIGGVAALMDGYNAPLTSLKYHKDYPITAANVVTASIAGSPTGRDVWLDPVAANTFDSRCGTTSSNVASTGASSQSNIIWVEVTVDATAATGTLDATGTIEIFLKSLGTG